MQVEVTRTYTAKQPDELSLQVADVVLVSQTVEDGTLVLLSLSLSSLFHICSLLFRPVYFSPPWGGSLKEMYLSV